MLIYKLHSFKKSFILLFICITILYPNRVKCQDDKNWINKSNPIIVQKLFENVVKYKDNFLSLKNMNQRSNIQNEDESNFNVFSKETQESSISIYPTTEKAIINSLGKELLSPSLYDEKKIEAKEAERIQSAINSENNKKEQENNYNNTENKQSNNNSLLKQMNLLSENSKLFRLKEKKIENIFSKNLVQETTVETYVFRYNPIYSLIYFTIIVIVLYIFIILRDYVKSHLNDQLTNTLNRILKDAIIIITLCAIIQVLNYFYFFGSNLINYINIDGICIDLAVFALLWLALGIYNVFISQSFVNRWIEFEYLLPERENIKRNFERLDNSINNKEKLTRVNIKEYYELKEKLEYFLLREEFLFPSFLPTVSENFLREDFFFAGYLSRAMAKTSEKSFKLSISSLFTIIVITLTWFLFEFISEDIEFFVMLGFPFLITLMLIILYRKMTKIYTLLVNVFNQTFDAQFPGFQQGRHPWINIGVLKSPGFLEINYENGHKPPPIRELVLPNKHEKIFWFASPNIHIRLLHFTLIIQVVWLVAFVTYYYKDTTMYIYIIVGLVIFSICINLLYFMPLNLYYLCINCNIQMLKDLKLINEVVMEQRKLTSLLISKLYRLIKSTNKLFKDEDYQKNINLREITKDQLKENFATLDPDNTESIKILSLVLLVHLCGKDIDDDELIFFARECSRDRDNIKEDDLINAVNKFTIDVTLEPSAVSSKVLQNMILKKKGKKEDFINAKLLENILKEHKIMDMGEINQLKHEISYLPTDNVMSYSISKLGNYIRNMIESLPR